MDAQPPPTSPDLHIARIAAAQFGIVAAIQLLAAGITYAMIGHRVRSGRLHPVHRGVYSVSPVLSERARQQAALLACGPESVLSHRSAASIWSLLPYPANARPWVTLPRSREARRAGIEVSQAPLLRQDVRQRDRLPLTSPPRTVIDLARLLDLYELEAILAEAEFRNLASASEIERQLTRYPNRAGNQRVREVLDLDGGPQRTRSPGERDLLRFLRWQGFARFEMNARVCGWEVDCLWRESRFAIELDGWDAHKGRVAFERDRQKWAELQASGVTVMPLTGRQLRDDEAALANRIRANLARLGPSDERTTLRGF